MCSWQHDSCASGYHGPPCAKVLHRLTQPYCSIRQVAVAEGWRVADKQVHVRPMLGPNEATAHAWSTIPSSSDRPLNLHALDEAQSCLVTCAPSSQAVKQGMSLTQNVVQHSDCSVCISADCSTCCTMLCLYS